MYCTIRYDRYDTTARAARAARSCACGGRRNRWAAEPPLQHAGRHAGQQAGQHDGVSIKNIHLFNF
eukprot:1775395-Lingulodinium_polyedra.AAC.1